MKWRNVDMVKDLAEIVKSFLEIILKGSEVNAKFLGKGQIPVEILSVERPSLSDSDIKSLKALKRLAMLAGLLTGLIIPFCILVPFLPVYYRIGVIGGTIITIPFCIISSVAFFSMEPNNIRAPRATLLGKANCYDDFFNAILTSLAFEGGESTDWSKKTGCIKVQRSEHYFSSPHEMILQVSALPDNSYKLDIEGLNPKNMQKNDIYVNSQNIYKFLTRVQALARNSFKEKTPAKELA
jgi:hypothetical protein